MDKIIIYQYDKKNHENIVTRIEETNSLITSWSYFSQKEDKRKIPEDTKEVFIDMTSLFMNEDRIDQLIASIEMLINDIQNRNGIPIKIIIDRKYSSYVKDLLYYKVDGIDDLEDFLHIENATINNIVDVSQSEFENIMNYLGSNLFGNNKFKERIREELIKYRLFNQIGQQPIFSVFICGASGIGKTEVARIFHRKLSPNEPEIKINLGNYSAQDALNSLIGSPRGYTGSNKGELSEKLSRSRSHVILIDEFEKASKQIFNFFLQLLEEGKFTDSLGREYDLNKYMIIFTSNMPRRKIGEYLPPELRSRFSYRCEFGLLSDSEKDEYVEYKAKLYLEKISKKFPEVSENFASKDFINIDVRKYDNLRDINNEIMRQITDKIYHKIIH